MMHFDETEFARLASSRTATRPIARGTCEHFNRGVLEGKIRYRTAMVAGEHVTCLTRSGALVSNLPQGPAAGLAELSVGQARTGSTAPARRVPGCGISDNFLGGNNG
jgi:hypothetical protein